MRFTLSACFVAALLPLAVQAGMYGQPVLNLDAKTFKTVMATEHAAMVAFVAPWCGHCKNLGPEYTAAASSLSPLIPFYAVDCDDQGNKPLCAEYQIKGFPTIKAFPRAGKGAARDYNGERKKGALVEYAKTLVPDRVKKLRIEGKGAGEPVIQGFLDEKPELPHILLVHPSTPSIPFLWKVLAHRLSGKAHLGFVRDTPSHTILTSLGIFDPSETTKDATRVIAWSNGAAARSDLTEYDGAMKFNALLDWIQTYLFGTSSSSGASSGNANGNDKQRANKAPEPITTAAAGAGAGSSANSGGTDAAARRAKMDEAERRDRERRERAAAAAAAAAGAEAAGGMPSAAEEGDGEGLGDKQGERTEQEEEEEGGASPVVPPEAVPQEGVQDIDIDIDTPLVDPLSEPAGPVPQQALEVAVEEPEQTGMVHEEL